MWIGECGDGQLMERGRRSGWRLKRNAYYTEAGKEKGGGKGEKKGRRKGEGRGGGRVGGKGEGRD